MPQSDHANWNPVATVRRWDNYEDNAAAHAAGLTPDSEDSYEGNLLLKAGITRMLNLLIDSGATQAFDSSHCRIGVGDSSTAADDDQTDLQAATNKRWELVDSVSVSNQTLTAVATFQTGDGNFDWNEWGIDAGTADGTTVTAPMLNRKVASMGTKASGAVWELTVTITVS